MKKKSISKPKKTTRPKVAAKPKKKSRKAPKASQAAAEPQLPTLEDAIVEDVVVEGGQEIPEGDLELSPEEDQKRRQEAREARARITEERQRAKALERQRAQEEQKAKEEQQRQAAAASSNVRPLRPDKDPIEFKLPELLHYKVQATTARMNIIRNQLKEPIKLELELEFVQRLNDACSKSEDYLKARSLQEGAINEVIALTQQQLPSGYAVSRIRDEEGTVLAVFDPDRAGKLLEVSKGG